MPLRLRKLRDIPQAGYVRGMFIPPRCLWKVHLKSSRLKVRKPVRVKADSYPQPFPLQPKSSGL